MGSEAKAQWATQAYRANQYQYIQAAADAFSVPASIRGRLTGRQCYYITQYSRVDVLGFRRV